MEKSPIGVIFWGLVTEDESCLGCEAGMDGEIDEIRGLVRSYIWG